VAVYCPRCGNRDVIDPRFCYSCSDGVADAARATEVVEAVAAGARDAARILGDISDPRALGVIVAAARSDSPTVRRHALRALGGIGDTRGIQAASASLSDPDQEIRREAIAALADMGEGAADTIAERLGDPEDRLDAATALAWLRDNRALEPLAMALDSDTLVQDLVFERGHVAALARVGGTGAIPSLERAADRVAAAADANLPEWQTVQAASTIAQALSDLRDPRADQIVDRLRSRFGRLYVMPAGPLETYLAPAHARRTVPRWSFTLKPSDEPITDPVGKVGGQPVWVEDPAWPLGSDGEPTTFMAQFAVPGRPGLIYLFLDPSDETYESPGLVFAQPGAGPESTIPLLEGPAFWSEVSGPPRYGRNMVLRMVESRIVLEPGYDFDDWQVLLDDPDVSRDDDRDWNKVGGNPLWLQGDETPDEPGWRFVFQFNATTMGREMADGAECYGLLNDDGRGRFVIQSH
jgi:hypothetical protein